MRLLVLFTFHDPNCFGCSPGDQFTANSRRYLYRAHFSVAARKPYFSLSNSSPPQKLTKPKISSSDHRQRYRGYSRVRSKNRRSENLRSLRCRFLLPPPPDTVRSVHSITSRTKIRPSTVRKCEQNREVRKAYGAVRMFVARKRREYDASRQPNFIHCEWTGASIDSAPAGNLVKTDRINCFPDTRLRSVTSISKTIHYSSH